MSDNVVNFTKDGTREMLVKTLEAYDAGRIQSVVIIGQGVTGEDRRCIMPLVSHDTSVHELTFAAALLQGYAQNTVQYLVRSGERMDA